MLGHEQWWIRFVALVYVDYDFIFFGFVLSNVDIPLLKDNLNNGLLRDNFMFRYLYLITLVFNFRKVD